VPLLTSACSLLAKCRLNEETGIIDYDRMEENAKLFRPKLIVAGASAYAKLIDYKRMKEICDRNGAWLLSDMAHISGNYAVQGLPIATTVVSCYSDHRISLHDNVRNDE
jgi:glycine/serine hydroxymethyltransferase